MTKMIENTSQTVRKVSAKIPETEIALAKAYIQGAVHAHCSSNPASELSVRILFGGDNRDWGKRQATDGCGKGDGLPRRARPSSQ